ncbi:DUF1127 domain-containing protein [Bradyrhizobium sp. LB11.1]|uniref:DUF1127 domain-containing protein n=1 Tax=Bradyrhizobium sp. LB11.1 TaxID=3156326 RepID=UPI003398837A
MLERHFSSNVNRVVWPIRSTLGRIPDFDLSDNHRGGRQARAMRPDAPADVSGPVDPSVEADSSTGWWSAVIRFVMEGFALYGAALHPNAAFLAETMQRGSASPPSCPADGWPHDGTSAQRGFQSPTSGSVVAPEIAAWTHLRPRSRLRRRWSWWAALGETVAVLVAHWRQEREINRAVAALSSYDDRTLRDLGIDGRADIERVVRYCRDC